MLYYYHFERFIVLMFGRAKVQTHKFNKLSLKPCLNFKEINDKYEL